MFQELLHNRLNVNGLLSHPLYEGLALEGMSRLNKEFPDFPGDFREHLAMHAMCQRLLERDDAAWADWNNRFVRLDAEATALFLQQHAAEQGLAVEDVLLSPSESVAAVLGDVGMVKLTSQNYDGLMNLPRAQLLDERTFLGQLLSERSEGGSGVGSSTSAG